MQKTKEFYLGKDECGDVFIYNWEPRLKGKEPNRCLVSIGDEEKIYDCETGFTEIGRLFPITEDIINSLEPLKIIKIKISIDYGML